MNSTRRGLFGWLAGAIAAPVAAKVVSAAPVEAPKGYWASTGLSCGHGAWTPYTIYDPGHTHGYADLAGGHPHHWATAPQIGLA